MREAEFDPFAQAKLQKTQSGQVLTIDRAMVAQRLAR
jgi:hypothetical protein